MKIFSAHILSRTFYYFQFFLLLSVALFLSCKTTIFHFFILLYKKSYCLFTYSFNLVVSTLGFYRKLVNKPRVSHFYSQSTKYFLRSSHLMNHQKGFTLLEVLIAFFILATGILGAVGMQVTAQKSSFNAMQRTIATLYAQEIIGKIKSNSSQVNVLEKYQGIYDHTTVAMPINRCNQENNQCNAQDRVLNDLYEWNKQLIGADVLLNNNHVGGLIDAKACIEYLNNKVTIYILWRNRGLNNIDSSAKNSVKGNCSQHSSLQYHQVIVSSFIY